MKTARKQWRRISLIMGIVLMTSLFFATGTMADPRPLNDWLGQQGQKSTFIPPDRDFLAWSIFAQLIDTGKTPFTSIDYAGLATEAYSPGNKPQISGSVDESLASDGHVLVTVMLETKNANAWVMTYDLSIPGSVNQFADNPTTFGNRPTDVQGGAPQALADCSLTLNFHNAGGLGAQLPDLVALVGNYDPNGIPQSDYIYYLFSATALGLMADGTPGKLTVLMEGIFEGGEYFTNLQEILTVEAVPLPPSVLLLGSGLLGLLGARRFRRS